MRIELSTNKIYKVKSLSVIFGGLAVLVVVFFSARVLFAQRLTAKIGENLIANPGFELGDVETISDWTISGHVELVEYGAHSGDRSVMVYADGNSSGIHSSWFKAPVHSRVEVSAWMKAEEVVSSGSYHMLRMTLQAYAADKRTRIAHWDLLATEGSFDWQHLQNSVIVPPGAEYLRLTLQLTKSSGTFWVDDVEARIVQVVPEIDLTGIEPPIVIPQPWQMWTAHEKLDLGQVGLVGFDTDHRLSWAMRQYLAQTGIAYTFVSAEESTEAYDTLIIAGNRSHAALDEYVAETFSEIYWPTLGDQGYFLSVRPGQEQNVIYLAANTEQGRFYAFQTFKQLVDAEQQRVYIATIADRPSLKRRGIPMGIQWFWEQEEVLERLASLKLNFVWNQGTFLNEKLWYKWREPLTEEEAAEIRAYIALADQYFIQPYIAIGPRGRDASEHTLYSSDSEIDKVVEKMEVLYGLGVRNFGLSFDDLGNFGQNVLFGEDIEFFNNSIGQAHAYFVDQVYRRLKKSHPDIKFMFIPMEYSSLASQGDAGKAYLESLAYLPEEIEIYSSIERTEGAHVAIETTQRAHMVWDNFWASFYQSEPAPQAVIPLDRPRGMNEELITGYSFAPLTPEMEDEYLVTWRTGADYAWAPERYNALTSFQMAVAQHIFRHNDKRSEQVVPTPAIVPDSGLYAPPLTVMLTLDGATANALDFLRSSIASDSTIAIHYTIDGSMPTKNSPLYRRPFLLINGTNVRVQARAFQGNEASSGIVSAFFQVDPSGMAYRPLEIDASPQNLVEFVFKGAAVVLTVLLTLSERQMTWLLGLVSLTLVSLLLLMGYVLILEFRK